ncbi:MAG: hypothetical protein HQK77_21730 [Desulfobacterales bacterium]|nr:hypothetical protein [Desulfobacterales bacterium]
MQKLGSDVDIEWAVDENQKLWLLQSRRLSIADSEKHKEIRSSHGVPLLEGGMTIFPGRAEGEIFYIDETMPKQVPKGCVLVVNQPIPDLAQFLPDISALLAVHGSPIGHLATLLREYAIPSLFRMGNMANYLPKEKLISVDATNRKIYAGSRWPGIKERVMARLTQGIPVKSSSPLFKLVLSLHLIDPFSARFKDRYCTSIHDVIRLIHEMAVRAMFHFGDQHNRIFSKRAKQVDTTLPIRIYALNLEHSWDSSSKKISVDKMNSLPFTAFWQGFSDTRLFWPKRWDREFSGLPADFREAVFGGIRGPRTPKDANYLMVSKEYLNINARFAYHYAMLDSLVGLGDHNNYVHFRFHGGGSSNIKRERRSRFVEWVLRESGFSVDRRGDLIIAWLRRYTQKESLSALTLLGRLMVCARQLDTMMHEDAFVKMYAEKFLSDDFSAFAF